MPVIFSKVHNYGHQHGECFIFIGLEDVQEVVILKEAHGTVSHLQMDASNAFHDALEQARNQMLNAVYLAYFQDFL